MTIPFAVCQPLEALNGGLFVSPGFGIHPVRVIDSSELIFVTRGHLDMFEEQRRFHLERNQTLLLRPGARHGGLLPYAADVNFFWVHFRAARGAAGDVRVAAPRVATVRDPEALSELFRRFISDQESGILDPLSASHLVALMVCMISEERERAGTRGSMVPGTAAQAQRGAAARDPTGKVAQGPTGRAARTPPGTATRPRRGRQPLADAINRYIEANFARPITTSAIARDLHYNADYLERIFRGRFRMSIIEALHQKRIGTARASLDGEPDKNINEIAFECGYTDPRYFRRIFKRLTGLTPKEFRTLYARTHINTH